MNPLKINCLVQVTTTNRIDFAEWLEYHVAIGFDYIYVFDTGMRAWLEEEAHKYKNVVFVPRDDWRKKSTIVKTYVSRRKHEEWAICLDDHEFLWIDSAVARNVHALMARFPQNANAITFYTKYLSSEKGMKNRVGTQIDCFTHAMNLPLSGTNPFTPNTGVTMFKVFDPKTMPLKNPVVPVTTLWYDTSLRQMTEDRLMNYLHSTQFNPSVFAARIYKYALRSGVEMEFKDGTKPVGYTVLDPAMQQMRNMLMKVPVNLETEKLFAKDIIPEETFDEPKIELTPEELAEHSLPITVAEIDQLILHGKYLEDVEDVVKTKSESYTDDVKAAVSRVFNRERVMIIKSATAYTNMQKMIDDGKTPDEIRSAMKLGLVTYEQMLSCLKVLDINGYLAEMNPQKVEPAVIAESASNVEIVSGNTEALPENASIEEITEQFDLTDQANSLSDEELAEQNAKFDELVTDRREKAKARRTKAKTKKTEKEEKKSALSISSEEAAELNKLVSECKEAADDLITDDDFKDDNLLNDIDVSSLAK